MPLPVDGDPDTELSTGPQDGLPIYASPPASQERLPEACSRCGLCARPFVVGMTLMACYHCRAAAHVRCLAGRMLFEAGGDESGVIPCEGLCWAPACARRLLWSRLVKNVQAYRPRSSTSGLEDEGPEDAPMGVGSGGVAVGDGPLVWRVDDSSDDDDHDDGDDEDAERGGAGDDSGCDSEQAVLEDGGGWSGGSASRANGKTEEEEEEDEGDSEDDEFWELGGCSQGRRAGGTEQTRRIAASRGESQRENRPSSSPPAVGRTQRPKPRKCEQDAVVVVDASDRNSSDKGSDCEGGDQGSTTPQSPPTLPLAERLRLRSLGTSTCRE